MSTSKNALEVSQPANVSRANVVIIATVATSALSVILTLLRLYVRKFVVKFWGWDDVHNVIAMLYMIVVTGLTLAAVHNGLGRHIEYVKPVHAVFAIKYLRISEFMLIMSTVHVKISISLLLMRLFVKSRSWRIFLWSFIAFNTTSSLLDAVLIWPQCTPVQLNWNKFLKGHCWPNSAINGIGIAQGTIAALTDYMLSFLPIYFLWNIRLIWRVKLGILALMCIGFAGSFAIARTILVPSLTTTHDPTWDLVELFMWAIFEANFGVIAAALPSVRPLLGRNRSNLQYTKETKRPVGLLKLNKHQRSQWSGTEASYGSQEVHINSRHDGQVQSDAVSNEAELWPAHDNEIMRKTDIVVESR